MANEAPPTGEPGFNLQADQGDRIRASNIAFIIIPTVFVVLRLVSRKISRAGYWWDDLLIVLALLLSYVLPILNLISIPRGFGRHIWILPLDATSMFLQTLWVFELFFGLTICFNKLSILAFYRRIFPIAQLRIVLLIMTAVVLCFTVTFVMIVIFQCVPIHAFWDVEDRVHARCVNVNLLFLVAGGVNCALDALIVFMVQP
ncbi:hypothetical protein HO173_006129 [Letharia columbiana]|uniref:Rhodopsin domain-containing protein n=1 Tax=Letharia columbiana TaxID=112416 RepID=A0A8H6FW70_9LECA|nr:uncharacterized protein HO173_006129 [Letharia columbiana]KAF6235933.1 hypothetical protein HO173_006129 [Letharia columbiana]